MPVIEISSLADSRLAVFASMTESQLRASVEAENGIFIAESPKVINVAVAAGYKPLSLLCEKKHIHGDAAEIIARFPDIPVFTGNRELLAKLTGYTLTRGVLCAFERKPGRTVEAVCAGASRVVVIDKVCDTTNIGAIFRSAAALGIDAVLLTPSSCDPFNRRSVRVSMGSVFLVPWTWIGNDMQPLRQLGFKTAAMALKNNSMSIGDKRLAEEPKLAIIMGTEGEGLEDEVIDAADYVVKIPMSHGVDSLNVAAAAAVAFWQLRSR